jgi:thiamine kinase-like enzyme
MNINEQPAHEISKIFCDILLVLDRIRQDDLKMIYRDISYDNILYTKNPDISVNGLLIDWEHAEMDAQIQDGGYKHHFCSISVSIYIS